jgi:hypothetical protein
MSDVFDQDAGPEEEPDGVEWPEPGPDPDVEPSHGDTTETGGDGGPAAS